VPDGKDPRINKFKRLFTAQANFFLTIDYEKVPTKKNKHDPALLRTSYLNQ
jgi:hypothetical protein